MKINYFGLLRSPVSWAKIGREIINELVIQGDEVCIYERKGFCYNSTFNIQHSSLIKNQFMHDSTLTFEYPKNYELITSKYKCGMLVYETTEAPPQWISYINKHLDILFLPNEFNRDIFIKAGVNPEITRVVPYGINADIFRPNAKGQMPNKELSTHEETFRFLTVAMPQKRKGLDILIKAFSEAFGGDKDTELVIKLPYQPGSSVYDLNFKSKISNIKLVVGEFTEAQMADIYCSADCFVLPSRAEGFGMIYLEALACGLPVIATGWGAHTEFLNNDNASLVDYKLVPAGEIQYDNKEGKGMMAEPDPDDLIQKMKNMRQSGTGNREPKKRVNNPAGSEFNTHHSTFNIPERYLWGNIVGEMKKYIIQG